MKATKTINRIIALNNGIIRCQNAISQANWTVNGDLKYDILLSQLVQKRSDLYFEIRNAYRIVGNRNQVSLALRYKGFQCISNLIVL